MSKKPSYPVQIFWSDEDEGYIAVVPDLPGCSAFGETAQEALGESGEAIEAWLEAARAAGNPIPRPSQPPLHKKHSGKLLVRMPQTLHGLLVMQAEREGVSLNQYVVYLLTEGSSHRQVTGHAVSAGIFSTYFSANLFGGAMHSTGPAASYNVLPFWEIGSGIQTMRPAISADKELTFYYQNPMKIIQEVANG
jgi:predicted RNase H-like HicB family nuclease